MIILNIKKPIRFKPKKWEHDDFQSFPDGISWTQFIGNHPNNHEQGIVTIAVELIEGTFDNISELLFIQEDPQSGKLLSFKKKLFGGYQIDVEFSTVFRHGLEYMTRHFISKGHGIIGLTKQDKDALRSIEGQWVLLSMLSQMMLPGKTKEILNLAIPSLRLIPNQSQHPEKSHFVGAPKTPTHSGIPLSKADMELFHLATLNLNELPMAKKIAPLKNHLTFYVNIQAITIENRWPQRNDDAKVFNYDEMAVRTSIQFKEIVPEINFDMIEFLDIPGWGNSALRLLNLNEDEDEQYLALESVYKNFLQKEGDQEEFNKLFGYPDSVQNCVLYEAERIKYNREYSDAIYKDAVKWRLILQVSPYVHSFSFLDQIGGGTIYFLIKEEDLLKGNFDTIQVVVQNT